MGLGAAATVGLGVAGAGLVGSVVQGQASKSAAKSAANSANQAAALQEAQYQQTRADLAPYSDAGQQNLPAYQSFYIVDADQLGNAYNNAFNHLPQPMTEANLMQTPGYQFNLSQGLRAVQNANAAQGLGVSGAALQGAARYATGLADSTYQNQYNNQQTLYNDYLQQANLKGNQLSSIYNMIGSPVTLGENAAAQTGNVGATLAGQAGNNLVNAGNAQAAGITGQANALAGGLNSVANGGLTYLGIQNALNSGGSDISSGGTF